MFWKKKQEIIKKRYAVEVYTYDGDNFPFDNVTISDGPNKTVRFTSENGYAVIPAKDIKLLHATEVK